MIDFVLIKYVHFIGIFSMVAALSIEAVMLKSNMSHTEMITLAKVDGLYGIGALVTLLAGLVMWFAVGKPVDYYSFNWVFHTKIGLFTIVGLLSIVPTIFFVKNRKKGQDVGVVIPKRIRVLVRLELVLLIIIPILATLMAQGFGQI